MERPTFTTARRTEDDEEAAKCHCIIRVRLDCALDGVRLYKVLHAGKGEK